MTVYFHHKHQKSGKYVRIAMIAYCRRVVTEFYNRMNTREVLLDNLKKYYENMGIRKNYCIENAIIPPSRSLTREQFRTKQYMGNKEFQFTMPFADKCSYYSIYVSILDSYVKFKTKKKLKIFKEEMVELITPIGWLTTGTNYYRLISSWILDDTIPSGNKTIAIVEQLVEKYNSLTGGVGQRCRPSRNFPLLKSQILLTNKILWETIECANVLSKFDYIKIITMLKEGFGLGDLATQHELSVTTLLGLIKDIRYVTNAKVAKNTKTEKYNTTNKKLKLNFKCMNVLFDELAQEEFHGHIYICENLGCEYLRDMGNCDILNYKKEDDKKSLEERIRKNDCPDSFHWNQSIFKIVQGKFLNTRTKDIATTSRKRSTSFHHYIPKRIGCGKIPKII